MIRQQTSFASLLFGAAIALGIAVWAPATVALEAGDRAPQFKAPALTGDGALSLADHKGKVVYVDFWASWCGPCLKALPALDELRKELEGQPFEVLAINVDRDPEKARAFLKKHGIGYPSATDPEGRLPEAFGLKTMPTSFLIDQKGVIRYVHPGFRKGDIAEIRTKVDQLLGKKVVGKK